MADRKATNRSGSGRRDIFAHAVVITLLPSHFFALLSHHTLAQILSARVLGPEELQRQEQLELLPRRVMAQPWCPSQLQAPNTGDNPGRATQISLPPSPSLPPSGLHRCKRDFGPSGSDGGGMQGRNVVRFEMPFDIFCEKCNECIHKGVRFNADKEKVQTALPTKVNAVTSSTILLTLSYLFGCQAGKYFSTTIWEFDMKCHLCDN
eukprot:2016624-Rhodomonas_salina.1